MSVKPVRWPKKLVVVLSVHVARQRAHPLVPNLNLKKAVFYNWPPLRSLYGHPKGREDGEKTGSQSSTSSPPTVVSLPSTLVLKPSPWQDKDGIACKTNAFPHQTQGLEPVNSSLARPCRPPCGEDCHRGGVQGKPIVWPGN